MYVSRFTSCKTNSCNEDDDAETKKDPLQCRNTHIEGSLERIVVRRMAVSSHLKKRSNHQSGGLWVGEKAKMQNIGAALFGDEIEAKDY